MPGAASREPSRARPAPARRRADEALRRWLPAALVFALTVVPFLPSLEGDFLNWDDDKNLVHNPAYRGLGWAQVRWMFSTTLMGHYIPLTWLSLGLNHALGGMDPRGYHLLNVLLHAAAAAAFYWVARRLLAAAVGGDPGGWRLACAAGAAALAFGVHPLRAESVAWITERRDALSGLFFLLAVLGYLRAVAAEPARRGRWWAASLGAYAASLLSKAAGMPMAAVLLLLDIYPLRRTGAGWRRLLVEKIPYAALGAAAAAVALHAQLSVEAVSEYGQYGLGARVALLGYSLVFYPWKFLWPPGLSPLYEMPARVDPLASRFLLPLVLALAVTAGLVRARRRWPAGLAAWVYAALMVLPVAGPVHAGPHLVADRYSYLSGLGFALLLGGGLLRVLRARPPARLAGGALLAAVAVLALWAAATWRQTGFWRDTETLWRRALAVAPACAVCAANLGMELILHPAREPARAREAEALLRGAIALRPDRAFAYDPLGVALARQGRLAEAEAAFREGMRGPASERVKATVNLGLLYASQERWSEAIPLLREGLAAGPPYPAVRASLAMALGRRAEQLLREGRRAEAEALRREAAALGAAPR